MLWISLLVIAAGMMVVNGQEGTPPGMPPMQTPQIPGITTADQFPQACVDCHLNYTEMNMDVRLSTIMKGMSEKVDPELLKKLQPTAPEGVTLKGKHPELGPEAFNNIPASCRTCHSPNSKTAPPAKQMTHVIHLTGEENIFLGMFGGECTHCHKLDKTTGLWSIPSAAEK
ncbi:MAG: hypothetical protein C4524_06575 [Candidatus Zixiibacteriota bacterium]|nr:MAG: hypothetical protein C4524_06575 [candidate division Zixibacteria bacterium]